MAGFDTSDVTAHVINPLQTIEGIADVQNKINQNKMFQAKALAGQYLTQSLGPNGQPDPDKFSAAILRDSRTAPYAPEILGEMQQIRQGGIAASQGQTNLATSQYNNMRNDDANAYAAAYSAAKGAAPNADPKTWDAAGRKASIATLTRNVPLGRYNQDQVSTYLGGGEFNSNTSRAAIISGEGGQGAQAATFGHPTQYNTGGEIQTQNVNEAAGTVTPMAGSGANIPTTVTPGEKMSIAAGLAPDTHQPIGIPGAIRADKYGNPTPGGPVGPGGVIQTGLAPGQLDLIAANQAQMNKVNSDYQQSLVDEGALKTMQSFKAGFRSGPGAAKTSDLLTEIHRIAPGLNIDPTDVTSQQVFNKLAQHYALTVSQDNGGRIPSQLQLQMERAANPNTEIADEANKEILAMMQGDAKRQQFVHAAQQDYVNHGGDAEHYQNHASRVGSIMDTRIFQEPYMTDQQRQEMYKSMSKEDIKTFNKKKAQVDQLMTKYGITP